MRELLFGVAELLAYLLGAAVLTAAGLFAEWTSIAYLNAGNTVFAAWLAVMGAVALYGGLVALGADEVLPRLRRTLEARS